MKYFILLIHTFALQIWLILAGAPFKISITKIECFADDKISVNATCSLVPVRHQVSTVNIAFTMISVQQKVFIRISNFQKASSNKYQPYLLDFTEDFCALSNKQTSILLKFLPNLKILAKEHIHPCPYSGHVEIRNISFAEVQFPSFMPRSDYRLEIRTFNGRNQTIYHLNVYLFIKSDVF